jgi:hypothetical protein
MSSVGSSSSTVTLCSKRQSNWLWIMRQYHFISEENFRCWSSCKQAGGKIVRESIATFQEQGKEEFFTIDELCKLRRATTKRERKAFFWFFGSFLECVCRRKGWGKQKQLALVSEATDKETHVKLVTNSDKAFALLLFDNCIRSGRNWS